jgi:putative intracellular protease/amidase
MKNFLSHTLLILCSLLLSSNLKADDSKEKILMVVTNHAKMPNGDATGFWLSEVSHPWASFTKAGFSVDFASPAGGNAPIDPRSKDLSDPDNKRFLENKGSLEALANTPAIKNLKASDYCAIFFAGGHGTMWDFPEAPGLSSLAGKIYSNKGVVAAVCHGPAALINIKLPDGSLLINGKKLTAFTNSEEEAVGLTKSVPFLLESKLKTQGAIYQSGPDFKPFTVTSGRLITGQNPASAAASAEAVIKLLKK